MYRIQINGSNILHKVNKTLNKSLVELIDKFSRFIFNNPQFLKLLRKIFKDCAMSGYKKKDINKIISVEAELYSSLGIKTFSELINRIFYLAYDKTNIPSYIIERLGDLVLEKKYITEASKSIKYHCKFIITYNSNRIESSKNIDICYQISNKGDYMECKNSLFTDKSKDNSKIMDLSKIKKHLDKINNIYGTEHLLYIFAFTYVSEKLQHYREFWPQMEFYGIDDIIDLISL